MRKLDKHENMDGFANLHLHVPPCIFAYSFAYPHDRMRDYQGTLVMFELISVSNY